jgi:hypothetical protein
VTGGAELVGCGMETERRHFDTLCVKYNIKPRIWPASCLFVFFLFDFQ